jgi:hypothetical protein
MESLDCLAVALDLAILGHHDNGALHRTDYGEKQIQENEGVFVEFSEKDEAGVEYNPNEDSE